MIKLIIFFLHAYICNQKETLIFVCSSFTSSIRIMFTMNFFRINFRILEKIQSQDRIELFPTCCFITWSAPFCLSSHPSTSCSLWVSSCGLLFLHTCMSPESLESWKKSMELKVVYKLMLQNLIGSWSTPASLQNWEALKFFVIY